MSPLPSYGYGREHKGPRYGSLIHGQDLKDVTITGMWRFLFLFLIHRNIFSTKNGGTTPKNNDGISDAGTNWLMLWRGLFRYVSLGLCFR